MRNQVDLSVSTSPVSLTKAAASSGQSSPVASTHPLIQKMVGRCRLPGGKRFLWICSQSSAEITDLEAIRPAGIYRQRVWAPGKINTGTICPVFPQVLTEHAPHHSQDLWIISYLECSCNRPLLRVVGFFRHKEVQLQDGEWESKLGHPREGEHQGSTLETDCDSDSGVLSGSFVVANKGFLKLDNLGLRACKVKAPSVTCAVVLTFGKPSSLPGSQDKLLNLHPQKEQVPFNPRGHFLGIKRCH